MVHRERTYRVCVVQRWPNRDEPANLIPDQTICVALVRLHRRQVRNSKTPTVRHRCASPVAFAPPSASETRFRPRLVVE
jgi:hypothetical protein